MSEGEVERAREEREGEERSKPKATSELKSTGRILMSKYCHLIC